LAWMPRYRTVLSSFEYQSSIWTALRFFVRRQINVALVRLSVCVP